MSSVSVLRCVWGLPWGGRELADQPSCGMPKDRVGLFFLIYIILFLPTLTFFVMFRKCDTFTQL